jgi:ribosomal protein L3 glutamine methyltransferase
MMRAVMNEADLEQRLAHAGTHEEWAMALAAFFAAHDLHFGHGTTNAYDEACWLVRHLQGWDDAKWDDRPDPSLVPAVLALARRRVHERRPLAYLLHEAWFAGLAFYVDERVLVPRSPFAELIGRCFAPWLELAAGDRVLEIGTGSGCIAIATALHCPGVLVDATDISGPALEVAARNVERHGVAARVHLERADLFPSGAQRYRAIIANPPYVPEREHAVLPDEYGHEPRIGLVGGRDGIELAARILDGARARLEPDGGVFIEVGAWADALTARCPRLELTWLELELGGEGVCFVTAQDLERYAGRERGRET